MGSTISKRPLTSTPTPSSTSTIITTASFSSSSSRLSRPWSDLSYDLLVSILSRLSSVDLIVGVSAVCSSWRAAARDPHCWRILDLSDWESVAARIPDHVDFSQVFKRALVFASDSERIEKVLLPSISNGQDLILVSNRLPNLLYLSFPNDDLREEEICSAVTNFKSLKGIDAVENFFHLTIEAVSHLRTVSEIKIINGEGLRIVLMDGVRDWVIVFLMCKVFPNLRKLEISCLCLNAYELQNVHKKVENYDISVIKACYKMFFIQ
ncbi:hypothetical protein LUZ60_001423 [Juncus effusus]|nr:hypothetical protein LUZ60_001423 [Juncus effusus]